MATQTVVAKPKTKVMRAARLHAYKQPFVVDEVPLPQPGPGQVLVKIAGSGFCHSDLHVMDGEVPLNIPLPVTLGHENAGYVAAAGPGVASVKEGDAVAIFGGWGDGTCSYCVSGQEQLCPNGQWIGLSKWGGGYAEYALVPQERYLVKLSSLDPRDAAPLTDAALTPYRAVRKALPYLQPDRMALVIGLGGLGQYGLKLLKLLSGCPVIAVDKSEAKLKAARAYGAAHALQADDPRLVERIMELTRGAGVAGAFDFVGADATLDTAIACTASDGKVSQIGLGGGTARLKLFGTMRFEVAYEFTLWGSIKELREVIALAESGRLQLNEAEHVPLDRINDVVSRLRRGDVRGRVIITP